MTNGVIIAQGGRFGGWALYVKDGVAPFVYNLLGMTEFVTDGDRGGPAGQPPGPGRVRRTTAAGWPRAATSPCTTTGARSAPVASTVPSR